MVTSQYVTHYTIQAPNFLRNRLTNLIDDQRYVEHPNDKRTKVYLNSLCHMTKMAARTTHSRIFFILNQLTDFNERWYVSWGPLAHHSLYKSRPLVGLDLFYDKIKCFSMGNSRNISIFRKFYSLSLKTLYILTAYIKV